MIQPTPRVLRLREHAFRAQPPSPVPEAELIRARAWLRSAGEPWTLVRRAKVTAALLRELTPVIDPDELLVGKYCLRLLTPQEADEIYRYREWGEPAAAPVWGQRAHMAIDIDKLLRLGLAGIRQ